MLCSFHEVLSRGSSQSEKNLERTAYVLGYPPCVTPLLKRLESNKMKTPLTLIHEATTTVAAASSALLWHLLARRFRMASTCDELLDLFEETYSVREDTAPLSWSNLEGKASESGAAAVAVDLGPSGDKLSARSLGAFVSDGKPTGFLCLRRFTINKGPRLRQRGCLCVARDSGSRVSPRAQENERHYVSPRWRQQCDSYSRRFAVVRFKDRDLDAPLSVA